MIGGHEARQEYIERDFDKGIWTPEASLLQKLVYFHNQGTAFLTWEPCGFAAAKIRVRSTAPSRKYVGFSDSVDNS